MRAAENGTGDRLVEIAAQERVLLMDQATVRACLDGLNGKYKQLVIMRYVHGYSWAKSGGGWVRRTARPGAGTSGPWNGWERPWRSYRGRAILRFVPRARVPNMRRGKMSRNTAHIRRRTRARCGRVFWELDGAKNSLKGAVFQWLRAWHVKISAMWEMAVEKQFANTRRREGIGWALYVGSLTQCGRICSGVNG